jgi:dihydroorotate dehydrogenase
VPALYRLLRPLLFRLEPETAHRLVFRALGLLQLVAERGVLRMGEPDAALAQRLWGLEFANPVGLAAGLDKNAELPHVWAALGFGFAELGTVTAEAQSGNPAPRLFRLVDDRALINRLGFNNRGAAAVAARLSVRLRQRRPPIPLGINLGKSRVTALEDAPDDYRRSLRALFPLADYVVVNVSSPNTPGLRDLQSGGQLARLLSVLREENAQLATIAGSSPRPILVKVAPDLTDDELGSLVTSARREGAAGFVATNTTLERPGLRTPAALASESGGLSGAPLRARSTAVVRALYRMAGPDLPIIGTGGIFTADDAYEKIRAGASLVQLYTGFVYEGPALPRMLCRGLAERLRRDGFSHLREAVGAESRIQNPASRMGAVPPTAAKGDSGISRRRGGDSEF